MVGQTRIESAIEVLVRKILSFGFNVFGNYFILNHFFGFGISMNQTFKVSLVFAIWGFIFSYAQRRLWNWLYLRRYK